MTAQEHLDAAMKALKIGEKATVGPEFTGTDWRFELERTSENRVDLTVFNLGPDDIRWFCDVTTVGHPLGAPMTKEEVTLGIPARNCGIEADGLIVGAIVFAENCDVTRRTSWSKIKKIEKGTFRISEDGEFFVNDVSEELFVWDLTRANKNRIDGWIALVAPGKPTRPPQLLELQEVLELAVKKGVITFK